MTNVPEHVQPFWLEFLKKTGRPEATPVYEVFRFSDCESTANSLADLVLRGEKVATASLAWEYESPAGHAPRRPPRPGDLSIVTSWDGRPLCILETTGVQVHAYEDVDEEFAAAEGEGDGSLASWREGHWSYFGRVCIRLGRERSEAMPVVCERFRVVFRCAGEADSHTTNRD